MRATRNILGYLLAGAALVGSTLPAALAQPSSPAALAGPAQEVLRKNCLECHGSPGHKISGKLNVTDRTQLLAKKEKILRRINDNDDPMPPAPKTPLSDADRKVLADWLTTGALETAAATPPPPAPAPAPPKSVPLGDKYVLQSIERDVQRLTPDQRRFARYFSLVHILNVEGNNKEVLDQHRDALTKAINHLHWERRLVQPVAIENTRTIFRVDIRELGWDRRPFRKVANDKLGDVSTFNLYDLVLLEYPYGLIGERSDEYFNVLRDFLVPANQVRPIPYVRADWFVSTATRPPLYHDLLQLPLTLPDLEKQLGVDSEADIKAQRAFRAGMLKSGVSRNNRVVEWHPMKFGSYWKSFDFKSSQETDNFFVDPINLHPAGGEMIFTLPNGLQGYYLANAKGQRLDVAPTQIVTDSFASDKTVSNGLSCIRCHDTGMKKFTDDVRSKVKLLPNVANFDLRDVLNLYPEQAQFDRIVQADEERFLKAMQRALGKRQEKDPLTPVSRGFLDERLRLARASAELGQAEPKNLEAVFSLPQFVQLGTASLVGPDGEMPRDTWEDYYDRVAKALGLGEPIVPIDGVTRPNYKPDVAAPFKLEVTTNKKGNTFNPKDELVIFVKASKAVNIEIIMNSMTNTKAILVPSTTRLKAGQTFRFPPEGQKINLPATVGDEEITVVACQSAFAGAEVLRGTNIGDRVVHPSIARLNSSNQAEIQLAPDRAKTVKKTITIEVR